MTRRILFTVILAALAVMVSADNNLALAKGKSKAAASRSFSGGSAGSFGGGKSFSAGKSLSNSIGSSSSFKSNSFKSGLSGKSLSNNALSGNSFSGKSSRQSMGSTKSKLPLGAGAPTFRPSLGGKLDLSKTPNLGVGNGLQVAPRLPGVGNTPIKPVSPILNPNVPIKPITPILNPNLPTKPFPPLKPIPIPKPIDPGIGNGANPGQGNGNDHDHGHGHGHGHGNPWFHCKPKFCHWWFDYCRPIRHCLPVDYRYCNWNYLVCDYVVNDVVVVQNARWYLGVQGMILPGSGLGIEAVEAGSPAELAGLRPGMVILRVNGIDLVDDAAMARAIARSNGLLAMDVMVQEGAEPAAVTVQLRRLVVASY